MPSTLFLPFTPSGRATELRAVEAKELLGLGPYDVVDPYSVVGRLRGRVLDASILDGCSQETRDVLLGAEADSWSGIGYGRVGANGEALILLNPTHHPRRQRVTLMEEILHVLFDHPKTELAVDGSNWQRPYNAAIEKEAYSVGAACIIPYRTLFRLVNDEHQSVNEIAKMFAVSEEYCHFRIKDSGLYRVYKKHCV